MRALLALLARHRRLLLFLPWAATLLVLVKLGGYRTFLRPELGAVLVGGYLILLLLVSAELFREREGTPHAAALLSPAVLLVPILFLLNARGAELDGYALQKRMAGTPRVAAGPAASPPAAPARDEVDASGALIVTPLDLNAAPGRYLGRDVALVGMVGKNDEVRGEFGPGALVAFRFRVACCAADAQPFAVVVRPRGAQPEPPESAWVQVRGRFRLVEARGEKVPVVEDASLSITSAPVPKYLY